MDLRLFFVAVPMLVAAIVAVELMPRASAVSPDARPCHAADPQYATIDGRPEMRAGPGEVLAGEAPPRAADGTILLASHPGNSDIYFYEATTFDSAVTCADFALAPESARDAGAGLVFWAASDFDYYFALFSPESRMVSIWHRLGKTGKARLAEHRATALSGDVASGATVRLRVETSGRTASVYASDVRVVDYTRADTPRNLRFGLRNESGTRGPAAFRVTNLTITTNS